MAGILAAIGFLMVGIGITGILFFRGHRDYFKKILAIPVVNASDTAKAASPCRAFGKISSDKPVISRLTGAKCAYCSLWVYTEHMVKDKRGRPDLKLITLFELSEGAKCFMQNNGSRILLDLRPLKNKSGSGEAGTGLEAFSIREDKTIGLQISADRLNRIKEGYRSGNDNSDDFVMPSRSILQKLILPSEEKYYADEYSIPLGKGVTVCGKLSSVDGQRGFVAGSGLKDILGADENGLRTEIDSRGKKLQISAAILALGIVLMAIGGFLNS